MLILTIVAIPCLSPTLSTERACASRVAHTQEAAAQPPDAGDQKEPPTPPHTGVRALFHNLVEDVQHLPSKRNLMLAGILGVHARRRAGRRRGGAGDADVFGR